MTGNNKFVGGNSISNMTIGMLHIVDVRTENTKTGEVGRHKLLMVGTEASDIERKLKWIFDASLYDSVVIKSVEKVRDKVHTISTKITQTKTAESSACGNPLLRGGGSITESFGVYAIGVVTTLVGRDPDHAIRRLGGALGSRGVQTKSNSSLLLPDDAQITVEELSAATGFVKPRDVSAEVNSARFVRG